MTHEEGQAADADPDFAAFWHFRQIDLCGGRCLGVAGWAELLHEWPDEALRQVGITRNTFVALLSHDPKLDVPAARVALEGKARYVGALGSKKTHQKRVAKLREAGVPEEQIARLHNPIGLDLGGRKAQEIAVAVIAEIVAVSHGIGAKPAD